MDKELPEIITSDQLKEYLRLGRIVLTPKGKLKHIPLDIPESKNKRSKSGKREDLDNRYFRSKWEANYARYLNHLIKLKQIVKWEYEVDDYEFPIKRGTRFYKPDFKVYYYDRFEYHEVKGYYDKRTITTMKRFKKYYPQYTVKMIDADWFKANKILQQIINNWE